MEMFPRILQSITCQTCCVNKSDSKILKKTYFIITLLHHFILHIWHQMENKHLHPQKKHPSSFSSCLLNGFDLHLLMVGLSSFLPLHQEVAPLWNTLCPGTNRMHRISRWWLQQWLFSLVKRMYHFHPLAALIDANTPDWRPKIWKNQHQQQWSLMQKNVWKTDTWIMEWLKKSFSFEENAATPNFAIGKTAGAIRSDDPCNVPRAIHVPEAGE